MAELTQAEAKALIELEKHRIDESLHSFPLSGEGISVPLRSVDNKENFKLDISRGRRKIKQITYQNRARSVVILVRLDIEGPPHKNPDGTRIPCPHLHIYREGFSDKWAIPAPTLDFSNLSDLGETLDDFMQYCCITKRPLFQGVLFS
jgi:hypothetical protein